MLYYVALRCVALCYVMLCYVMLCYVMLCYVTGTGAVALVSSCNLLWCVRSLLVPTSLLAVLPSIQGCNTVH